jgi:hypothetical protein
LLDDLFSFIDDPLYELGTGGNVMDQALNHSNRPYTAFRITLFVNRTTL